MIQQGPDQNNLTANIKGQMDALKINSQRIFDFGQRCAKSSPEPATTTTETSAISFSSKQIYILYLLYIPIPKCISNVIFISTFTKKTKI